MSSDDFQEVTLFFRSFPIGYHDDSLMLLRDTSAFLSVPVAGICGILPVPVRVNSGGKTASDFRVYFRRVPF